MNNFTKILILLMSFNVLLYFMLPELALSGYITQVYQFNTSSNSISSAGSGLLFNNMSAQRKVYGSSADLGGNVVHFIFELAVVGPFLLSLFDVITMPIALSNTIANGLGWGGLIPTLIGGGYMIMFFMSLIGAIRGTGDG